MTKGGTYEDGIEAAAKKAAETFLNDYEQDKASLDSWTLAEYFVRALASPPPGAGDMPESYRQAQAEVRAGWPEYATPSREGEK